MNDPISSNEVMLSALSMAKIHREPQSITAQQDTFKQVTLALMPALINKNISTRQAIMQCITVARWINTINDIIRLPQKYQHIEDDELKARGEYWQDDNNQPTGGK